MVDYKKMYFNLSGAVANAIEILIAVQQNGEESYINADDTPIRILDLREEPNEDEKRE